MTKNFGLIKEKFRDSYVVRTGQKEFKCKFCDQVSRCFIESAEHVFAIHLDNGAQFPCSICEWKGTRKSLIKHSRRAHKVSLNLFGLEMSHVPL